MKLPIISGSEVVKRLKKVGFVETRQKSSHLRLEKDSLKITVPMHHSLKKGTLNRIIKDSGLTLKDFEALK